MPLISFPVDLTDPATRAHALRKAIAFYRMGGRPTWDQYQQMTEVETQIFTEAYERVSFAEETMRVSVGKQIDPLVENPDEPSLVEKAMGRQQQELSGQAGQFGPQRPPAPVTRLAEFPGVHEEAPEDLTAEPEVPTS